MDQPPKHDMEKESQEHLIRSKREEPGDKTVEHCSSLVHGCDIAGDRAQGLSGRGDSTLTGIGSWKYRELTPTPDTITSF